MVMDGAGAARIELGTGVTAYVELGDEDPVELVFGPQGGWHIDVAARFWNLDPDTIDLEYQFVLDGTDEPVNYPARYTLTRRRVIDMGDHFVRLGDRAVLDITQPGGVLSTAGTLSVRAITGDTELASSRRHVRVVDEAP